MDFEYIKTIWELIKKNYFVIFTIIIVLSLYFVFEFNYYFYYDIPWSFFEFDTSLFLLKPIYFSIYLHAVLIVILPFISFSILNFFFDLFNKNPKTNLYFIVFSLLFVGLYLFGRDYYLSQIYPINFFVYASIFVNTISNTKQDIDYDNMMKYIFNFSVYFFISVIVTDRKSTRLNSSHALTSRMPSSA